MICLSGTGYLLKRLLNKNVEFNKIPHKSPELVIYNAGGLQIERIDLSKLNRQQCNDLLKEKGFREKTGTPSSDL
uniref:Selenoprotein F/M domain-containing protein n=1 Tax=Romanomermis culicivorax TaxID=13658 RepID=A0A915JBM7_ROMCU